MAAPLVHPGQVLKDVLTLLFNLWRYAVALAVNRLNILQSEFGMFLFYEHEGQYFLDNRARVGSAQYPAPKRSVMLRRILIAEIDAATQLGNQPVHYIFIAI